MRHAISDKNSSRDGRNQALFQEYFRDLVPIPHMQWAGVWPNLLLHPATRGAFDPIDTDISPSWASRWLAIPEMADAVVLQRWPVVISEGLPNLISLSRQSKVRYLMWLLAGFMEPPPPGTSVWSRSVICDIKAKQNTLHTLPGDQRVSEWMTLIQLDAQTWL